MATNERQLDMIYRSLKELRSADESYVERRRLHPELFEDLRRGGSATSRPAQAVPRPTGLCDYCGGLPGASLSCVHCGAPNLMARALPPHQATESSNQRFIEDFFKRESGKRTTAMKLGVGMGLLGIGGFIR